MRQNVGEERLESDIDHGIVSQSSACDGKEYAAEFRLLHIFQHYPLAALLLHHAVVVRQIVSSGLYAVSAVASAQDFVHYANGSRRAQLWIPVLRVQRQVV